MYSFWVQSWSTYKGLFAWLNWPGYISAAVVQPFATVIMYTVLGRLANDIDIIRTYSLGIAVVSMAFILIGGLSQSYQYDRSYGTISFLFVSPANRLVNFLSRAIFHFPNGLLSFTLGMIAAWLIVDLNFSAVNWAGFVTSIIVISVSLTAFGQLLGVISIVTRDWIAIQGLANSILFVFCGAIIPLSVFPHFIQEFAELLPVTNGLIAIRESFGGTAIQNVSGSIIREAVTAVIYYLVSFICFSYFEQKVKQTGALERDII